MLFKCGFNVPPGSFLSSFRVGFSVLYTKSLILCSEVDTFGDIVFNTHFLNPYDGTLKRSTVFTEAEQILLKVFIPQFLHIWKKKIFQKKEPQNVNRRPSVKNVSLEFTCFYHQLNKRAAAQASPPQISRGSSL